MFAPWIPEALKRIEELELLPNPPAPLAITRARREIVNVGMDYPMPIIEVGCDLLGHITDPSVLIRWPDGRGMMISANGAVCDFR